MIAFLSSPTFRNLAAKLGSLPTPERTDEWPEPQFQLLREADGWKWNIPQECGGIGMDTRDLLEVYRELAGFSLVTTFILTQRNAACSRIELSGNTDLRRELLTGLCRGELFATVGISHLTTSRQHLQTPAVTVQRLPAVGGYLMTGHVPWATGANQADILVTGGTLSNGTQLLAAVPLKRDGVTVLPPVGLLGLSASQTGAVSLQDVFVADDEVLHGPMVKVMSQGAAGGAGSLGTSALAIGAAQGTLRQCTEEARHRPELHEFLSPLQAEAAELAMQLRQAATDVDVGTLAVEMLRRRANLLVTRAAQVWLAATKGAGYVSGHPAERAVRESMFFLVWSCPQPVLAANLRDLTCEK